MRGTMPIGEIVRPLERGQVTIPIEYRRKLKITPKTPLNVLLLDDIIIIVPVELTARGKVKDNFKKWTDWTDPQCTVEKYMEAVRYNPLEKLRAKRLREGW